MSPRTRRGRYAASSNLNTPSCSSATSPAPSTTLQPGMSPFMSLEDAATLNIQVMSPFGAGKDKSDQAYASDGEEDKAKPGRSSVSKLKTISPLQQESVVPWTQHEHLDNSEQEDDGPEISSSPPPLPQSGAPKMLPAKSKGDKGKQKKQPAGTFNEQSEFSDTGHSSASSFSSASVTDISSAVITKKKTSKDRLRLTDEEEEDLVNWYRDNPILYDKTCREYRNTEKKNAIHAEKAATMGKTAYDLQTWRNSMRTQYGKLTKPGPSGTEKKNLTVREKWIVKCFSFLKNHVTHKSGLEVGAVVSSWGRSKAAQQQVQQKDISISSTKRLVEARSEVLESQDHSSLLDGSSSSSVAFQGRPGTGKKRRASEDVCVRDILEEMRRFHSSRDAVPPASHPFLEKYSAVNEKWKTACTLLFQEGLDLPHHLRVPIVKEMTFKIYQAQEQHHQQLVQQKQHQQEAFQSVPMMPSSTFHLPAPTFPSQLFEPSMQQRFQPSQSQRM